VFAGLGGVGHSNKADMVGSKSISRLAIRSDMSV
jgi:hypothetical protein